MVTDENYVDTISVVPYHGNINNMHFNSIKIMILFKPLLEPNVQYVQFNAGSPEIKLVI